jgi:hypothetical protein
MTSESRDREYQRRTPEMRTYDWIWMQRLDNDGWKLRHRDALLSPRGFETAIVFGLQGWISYAVCYERRYQSGIGTDSVLGPAWFSWGESLRTLLNGEVGRLDAGTVDAIITHNMTLFGWKE